MTKKKPTEDKNPIRFEQSLDQLEGIVDQLESGELPLQEALDAFKSGVTLAQQCQKSLADAELEVKMLIENKNGETSLVNFDSAQDKEAP